MRPNITIEEINSLTEDEASMLLFLCNVWAPIHPGVPTEEEPYLATLNTIRSAHRMAIIDRVIQACAIISPEGKEVYESLRSKLKIPNPPVEQTKIDLSTTSSVEIPSTTTGSVETSTTGSNV